MKKAMIAVVASALFLSSVGCIPTDTLGPVSTQALLLVMFLAEMVSGSTI